MEYRREYLGGNVTALVSDEHSFGTDAILLADFARPRKSDFVCDLGTGCGIIPLLWCREKRTEKITAIEIRAQACEQLTAALELDSLGEKIEVVNADLKKLKGVVPFGRYDLVTMNPPYKAPGSGMKSTTEAALTARHEVACELSDIVKTASDLLKFGGRFCLCHRPERLTDVLTEMRKNSVEPKRLQTVVQQHGKAPWLILVEGKKGGKSGMIIEPELSIMNGDEYSDELKKIYDGYCKEQKTVKV